MQKRFYQTTIGESINDLLPLLKTHYEEVSIYSKFGHEFEPDIDLYIAASKAGSLKTYVLEVEGMIAGYVMYSISLHPHCKKLVIGMMDMIYLDPKFRNLGLGQELMKYAEEDLKLLKVNYIFAAMTEHFDFTKTMDALNYKLADKLFVKGV
jgi:GNAT superfamily N-acetyltransferase